MSACVIETAKGLVDVQPIPDGRFHVSLQPNDSVLYVPRRSCVTSFPPEVISAFADISYEWLCDSLARHEDADYVSGVLERQLLAYVERSDFAGKRILDFGCGSGASTFCIGTLFPDAEVIGVELDATNVRLARQVLAARRLANVSFERSPDPNSLPPAIGTFDFVMLSAVYEHLLPEERRQVMPLIWSHLNTGGVLFVNQTPYRYFPYEHHSTGLWFINYCPDRFSHFLARKLSARNPAINSSSDWRVHLRGGIRGGTEAQIIRNLRLAKTGRPKVIQPRQGDRASYWLSCTSDKRHRLLKRFVAGLFGLTDRALGTVPSMNLDVAIRKEPA